MLNLWGFIRKKNVYLPITNIILSNKSYELYDKVIKEFLLFFDNFKIEIDFNNKSIMCDFEHSLRTAIKNNIKDIKLRGCFFHFSKSIYKKCKEYGLFTKNRKKDKIIISFILKLYPYIPTDLRKDYINKIENHIKNLDKGYQKLISYFNKNWINSKFFNFSEINNDDIIKRTNNIC